MGEIFKLDLPPAPHTLLLKSINRFLFLWEIRRKRRSAKRKSVLLGRVVNVFVMVNKRKRQMSLLINKLFHTRNNNF